jgi:hypothetical protein
MISVGKKSHLLLSLILFGCSGFLQAAEILVSPFGNDGNPGTLALPKATLQAAFRQARELRRLNDSTVVGGIHIRLKGGTYFLNETLLLTPEDSGTPESPILVEACGKETPMLSGGLLVKGWRKVTGKVPGLSALDVFEADVPRCSGRRFDFRQVWVNGTKASVAANTDEGHLLRILAVDAKNRTIRIPVEVGKTFLKPSEMELFLHQMWATAVLRISSIEQQGGEAVLHFHQPESNIEFDHPWPPPVISDKGGGQG